MTEHVQTTLREANRVRQAEWDAGNQITLSYRGNELAGETGEACNIIKKLERERLGIRGSRASVEKLAEELADVVICADLIALAEGIDLDKAVAAKFNATSEEVGLKTRYAPDAVSPDYQSAVMFLTDLSQRLAAGQDIRVPTYLVCAIDAITCVIAGPAGKLTITDDAALDRAVEQAERMIMVIAALKVALSAEKHDDAKACIQAALDFATNDQEALAEGAALAPAEAV